MKVEKGLTLLSAAFSGQSAALSAGWESDWVSLLNFDFFISCGQKSTYPTVEFDLVYNLQRLDTLLCCGHT